MTPDQYMLKQKMINVGDGHKVFTYLWGNADADTTIVFLHGGPGSGCNDGHKSYFDPEKYKVIFFDQRGCGKSLPYGSLKDNNTDKLIEDINTITQNYGISKFILVGGSWGSLLALAYGIKYPDKVIRMVLRGIFTGRASEDEYLYQGYFKYYFPDIWADFLNATPKQYRQEPAKYHLDRVFSKNKQESKKAAFVLNKLEGSLLRLDDRIQPLDYDSFDPVSATIELHFIVNRCFIEDRYILNNAHKLTMPIDIVQGRYDMICPPITAYELNEKLPNSKLSFTIAGHSGNDRANWELVKNILDTT